MCSPDDSFTPSMTARSDWNQRNTRGHRRAYNRFRRFATPSEKEGGRAIKPLEREARVVITNREAHLVLVRVTNHPVCAAKERGHFINGAATPPLKGGEWIRLATNPFPV